MIVVFDTKSFDKCTVNKVNLQCLFSDLHEI